MPTSTIKSIHFHFLDTRFYLSNRTDLKKFILQLFNTEKVKVNAINYVFCSDSYLIGLNKKYLSHNTYTDIITFPYSDSFEPVLSDVYISIDRVKENAKLFNTSFQIELLRVIFHGALHLCGYKDKTKRDAQLMRAKEDYFLDAYVSRGNK